MPVIDAAFARLEDLEEKASAEYAQWLAEEKAIEGAGASSGSWECHSEIVMVGPRLSGGE
jgi:hypothetical protein